MRDVTYGICRNYSATKLVLWYPGLHSDSPAVLFVVVLCACLGSAPFNEMRAYMLQTRGQRMPFMEFFRPINFARSSGLGAAQMAISLSFGYWLTPFVARLMPSWR